MRPIQRPRSLTETVLAQLRESIVSGDLELGSALSERALAIKLGVSKTPVREALAQLRVEGLVRIYPQRGAYVFTLSAHEVIALCEFRQTLEAAALRLAVERRPTELAKEVRAIVSDMGSARKTNDTKAYLHADTRFHQAFFRRCGNDYLVDTYELHIGKIAALRTHLAVKPLHTEMSYREHCELSELIVKGELQKALGVLDVHIDRTKSTYSAEIDDIAMADRQALIT
jgi:DNA-binding GntR family transcriptional regulator